MAVSACYAPRSLEHRLKQSSLRRARDAGNKLNDSTGPILQDPAEIFHEVLVGFDWFVAALSARLNVSPGTSFQDEII